ncbi:MAG: RNA polymerase sigma-70 factor [Cyclobacteriaceae bacterium]
MLEFQHTDAELVRLLSHDDQRAFDLIYNSYWERMYGMAYNRIQSKEAAEGIVQDIFTELWERRHKLTIYKSLTSYLFSALKYKILNHYASSKVRRKYVDENMALIPVLDNSTQERLSFDELYGVISREIAKLPEKCRVVFRLKQDGRTAKEIAKQLKISSRTAEGHITQARKILKTKLADYTIIIGLILSTL